MELFRRGGSDFTRVGFLGADRQTRRGVDACVALAEGEGIVKPVGVWTLASPSRERGRRKRPHPPPPPLRVRSRFRGNVAKYLPL
ncbi:MAG: hypothetical protein E6J21_13210 [Chloroflexota bacterium]|nr:MAG: hypothetical protein E6J21_13210 [Chloroflexota bacterium]